MKQKLTTTIVAFATCLIANAEPDKEKRPGGPRGDRPVPKQILEKFDKDGDGKLSADERKAAMEARKAEMEARRAEMMKKFDKDGDGKLSEDERKAAMEARKAEMIKKFDKDGDGELNEEERKAARESMPEPAKRRAEAAKRGKGGPEGGGRAKRGPKTEGPKPE